MARHAKPTFILPIDQGEELYASDGVDESAQLRTAACRLEAGACQCSSAQQNGLSLLALVTIRTDLYVHLQNDALLRDIGRQMIDLTPMDRTEYKRIIEGPAQRATEAGKALVIEPALSRAITRRYPRCRCVAYACLHTGAAVLRLRRRW